jgi:hypothetical protein
MPGAGRTRSLVGGKGQAAHKHSHRGLAETIRHSLRDGFTAAPCSPRSLGLVSLRRYANRIAQLDPSVEGTGPHGLTVRIAPHVLRPKASIASRANDK